MTVTRASMRPLFACKLRCTSYIIVDLGTRFAPPHIPYFLNRVPKMNRARRAGRRDVDDAFPHIMSVTLLSNITRLPGSQKPPAIKRAPSAADAVPVVADQMTALQKDLEAAMFPPAPIDRTKVLPLWIKQLIASFVGGTLADCEGLLATSRDWRQATCGVVTSISVVPDAFPLGILEQANFAHFMAHLQSTHGPSVRRLSLVDSTSVFSLPQTALGPIIHVQSLLSIAACVPSLQVLDVRGVVLGQHSTVSDLFLSSLHQFCPSLRVLKVGSPLIQNWEPCWWVRLPVLCEFVVGSQREDVDWENSQPINLHADFFNMLHSPLHFWRSVKLWVRLARPSFRALVLPLHPLPRVAHLTLNAFGNTDVKPLEATVSDAREGDKKKPHEKPSKKAATEEVTVPKGQFPALTSFTVADIGDRPEFAIELMTKLLSQAPSFKDFNVVCTHRLAPSHVEVGGRQRRKRQ